MTVVLDQILRTHSRRLIGSRIAGHITPAIMWLTLFLQSAAAAGATLCPGAYEMCTESLPYQTNAKPPPVDPERQHVRSEWLNRDRAPSEAANGSNTSSASDPLVPWYRTSAGIAGIGIAATAATMPFDRYVNKFTIRSVNSGFRNHTALDIADGFTDASLLFAGATMFQSPWSSQSLAHTSSVAATASIITTVEVFGLKFAFGRARPGGPDSSPYDFQPFSTHYDLISGSALHLGGGNTASFPSGHTAVAFAAITPYAKVYDEPWLYAIPVVVGLSRIVAVDGHWASDVVGGGFLGWLTANLTVRFFPKSDLGVMIFGNRLQIRKTF